MRAQQIGRILAVLVGTLAVAADSADAVKSGPQVGAKISKSFEVRLCNSPDVGDMACLVWRNDQNPVAMVFAREISGPLTSLVKKLDEATIKNKDRKLGSFVVFLSDDTGTAEKLIALAEKEKIAQTILALGEAAGPDGYDVAAEADVTVVLYTGRVVKASYVFKKGKMTADDVTRIVADLSKIVPSK